MAIRSRRLGRALDLGLRWILYAGRPTPPEAFAPDRVRRILVVRNDNLGDLLCTTPGLRALRARFPSARIAVLVPEHCRGVLHGNPDIDEVITYTKAKHRRRGTTVGAWWQMARMFRGVWSRHFDLAISMRQRFSPHAAWLLYASRVPWRLGNRPPAEEPLGFFLNVGEPQPGIHEAQHEVDAVLGILRPLGIPPVPRRLTLCAEPAAWERVGRRLAERGIGPDDRVALVHISNRRPTSRWPLDRFAAVAEALAERHGFRVLLNWAPGDASNPLFPGDDALARDLLRRLRISVESWETSTLEDFIATVRRSQFVFSTDGGLMHFAAAFDVPQVVVFGKTPIEGWRPCSSVARALKRGQEAASVPAEEVLQTIQALGEELGWPTARHARGTPGEAVREAHP